ncbi:DinB family protein [Pseudalkalibacillus sp. NRS-1564]|uniref:DinB family protein n=1 Tax=Pseudalkalibacillus sp. NRS-1564 TaxID=3233900 RepID=UPI003D2CB74D
MKDAQLLKQFTFWRYRTLQALDAVTEEQADVLPEGFTNTVRWNLGHVLVTAEFVLDRFTVMEKSLPINYSALFKAGTRPGDWTEEPPSLIEIKHYLIEQNKRISELEGELSESLQSEFSIGSYLTLETVGELILFLMNHENLHLGTISGIKRAQGMKELWKKTNCMSTA